MSKILVTGATGFTGKALCRHLVERGENIVAFVRAKSKIEDLSAIGVECRVVDIKNKEDIHDNFSEIIQVYHIAAAYRTEHTEKNEFQLVNVEATRNLLAAAKESKINRFVHCSTVGVQGCIDDPPADENYRFSPGDHYQGSKLEGELLARKYFSECLPGTVVRPAAIYGPGDKRFLKLFKAINKKRFIMIGKGNVFYHMIYIDDLVQGIWLAGHKAEALGEVFNIAGEEYTTITELVNLIADVLDKPRPRFRIPYTPVYIASEICDKLFRPLGIEPPIYPRRVKFFKLDRAFNIDKAKRLLGYKPQTSLRDGLANTASWYKQMGLL